jgi:hypothetical protein
MDTIMDCDDVTVQHGAALQSQHRERMLAQVAVTTVGYS